jgi:hypothetical protein
MQGIFVDVEFGLLHKFVMQALLCSGSPGQSIPVRVKVFGSILSTNLPRLPDMSNLYVDGFSYTEKTQAIPHTFFFSIALSSKLPSATVKPAWTETKRFRKIIVRIKVAINILFILSPYILSELKTRYKEVYHFELIYII